MNTPSFCVLRRKLRTDVAIVTSVIYTSGIFLHFLLKLIHKENVTNNRQNEGNVRRKT